MENYEKPYLKLFNALTDLAEEARHLAQRMETVQQECEEIILNEVEEPN